MPPTVTVRASYPGANAETVAATIATPIEQEVNGVDKASNLVVSADYALAPGLVLAGDVGFFDNDAAGGAATGDKGWQAVGRVGLAF